MSKIIFDKEIPESIRAELEKYVLPCEWLIPAWCQKVLIGWSEDSDEDGAAISAYVVYEYRRARFTFYPCFHTQSDQQEAVVHEFFHAFVGVLADYARDEIKRLIPEDEAPKYRQSVLDELARRHEAVVQDLAYCVMSNGKINGS